MRTQLIAFLLTVLGLGCCSICAAADAIVTGTVKGIVLEKREFVLTDSKGTDSTIKLAENVVINRGGKDGQGELKVKDVVCVSYEKGALIPTAKYILIQEGDSKNWKLAHGDLKHYDAAKNEITYTDSEGKDSTYSSVGVKLLVNRVEAKFESLNIGEHLLAILQIAGDQSTLKSLVVERK